ncbi:MAG: aminotransferase class V-fold PLP-dependent enzyme, partial [Planctomycetes bacterium]|nr:aminotransferase class V-fold PLP-dependent enzyme [Planctomycetota bacterium]
MVDSVYFDNNATTRPLPEVLDVTLRCSRDEYANPSSVHRFGQSARHKVETAREQVAGLIGASPREIVFTSSGTESINLAIQQAGSAIRGALRGRAGKRRFVTTAVEHSAGMRMAEQLETEGYTVEYVGVDSEGRLDLTEWGEKVTEDTALASLIHTNNETGVILDVAGAIAIAAERTVPVHGDAV